MLQKNLLNLAALTVLAMLPGLAAAKTISRIVALGDSLTDGYGVAQSESFPAILQERLRSEFGNKELVVINAGISGSTSASALSRLKWLLKTPTDLVILSLGANDGLRGTKPADTKKNLATAIEFLQSAKVEIILSGMKIPPNYGKEYTKEFEGLYPELAKQYSLPLIPFLLEGVAGNRSLNQADGIHPTAAGHKLLAETVYRALLPVLKKGQKK